MPRRRYSDDERANALAALAANGGDVSRTAAQLGIPERTLHHWSAGDRHPESAQMGEEKKEPLADAFEKVARQLVGVAAKKADKLNAKDAMIAAGVATDKMQLLRGKPTSITDDNLTLTERMARLAALADAVRGRRAGSVADNGHAGALAGGPISDDEAGRNGTGPLADTASGE